MNITSPILKHLSLQISEGNPWWGLAVANEYVPASSPLHHALACQFVKRVGSTSGDLQRLADQLIAGARFEELPPQLQRRIGKRAFAIGREMPQQTLTVRRSPWRTARQAPPRLRNYKLPRQLTAQRQYGDSSRRTSLLNPKIFSRAPHATLRGVRMSS
jgi:hypothetical protein